MTALRFCSPTESQPHSSYKRSSISRAPSWRPPTTRPATPCTDWRCVSCTTWRRILSSSVATILSPGTTTPVWRGTSSSRSGTSLTALHLGWQTDRSSGALLASIFLNRQHFSWKNNSVEKYFRRESSWTWRWTTSSTTRTTLRPHSPVLRPVGRPCEHQNMNSTIESISPFFVLPDIRWTLWALMQGPTGSVCSFSSTRTWRWQFQSFKLGWRPWPRGSVESSEWARSFSGSWSLHSLPSEHF